MSNESSRAVEVCGTLSWFVQVTLVPAATVTSSGSYTNSTMSTCTLPSAAGAASSEASPPSSSPQAAAPVPDRARTAAVANDRY